MVQEFDSTERLDLAAVAGAALERAAAMLGTDHGCLVLIAADGSAHEPGRMIGLFAQSGAAGPPGQDLLHQVRRDGRPLLVADYPSWPGRTGATGGIGTMLAVPLARAGRVLGVLAVAHPSGCGRAFSDSDAALLNGLAQMTGLALDGTARGAEAQRALEEAERLRAATEALSASLDVQEVLVRILTELRKVVPYDSASVQERSGDQLRIIGGHGFPDLQSVLGISFDLTSPDFPNGEVVRGRIPVIVADAPGSYAFFEAIPHTKAGIRSFLGVPLLFGEDVIGMLALDSKEVGFYTERHAQLAMAFAAPAAIAIRNARLHAEAQLELAARKRTEERLAESENLLRTIIESEPECVKLLAADGSLMQMNPAGLAMIEADSFEQVARAKLEQLIVPAWRPAFRTLTNAVFRGEPGDLEFEIVGLKGTRRWLETRAVPLRDPQGTIVAMLGVTRDATARKQAESALRQSEARLSEAQRLAHIGSWDWDIERNGFWWSAETYALFDLSDQEQPSYEAFLAAVHSEDRERVQHALKLALAEGAPYSIEFRMVRPDGAERHIYAEGLPQFDEGRAVRMTGTVQDVTDRKRNEQALRDRDKQLRQAQRIESLGLLAGGVAHDFNNLLGVIVGYGELLNKDLPVGTPGRARLDQILQAAQRATTLTRQLLAFSRRQVLQPRRLDLNAVVRDTEALLARLIGEDIELATVTAAGIGQVLADPGQIEQVLMNLAVNSRDAMPHGGRLLIETARVELAEDDPQRLAFVPPGSYVTLAVSDTGVGMDEATRARIFEPFFTTKETGKGTGLGLAMVYGFVKQSGGHIHVHSALGSGTSFRIYLPWLEERPAGAAAEAAPAPELRGSETILVVEDETALRELIGELLADQGYTVLEARHAEDALGVSARHGGEIDLLITDVVMPGMNGRELAERLAGSRSNMAVLYVSGYTDDALDSHDVLHQRLALLQKPFTAAALASKVRETLDRFLR